MRLKSLRQQGAFQSADGNDNDTGDEDEDDRFQENEQSVDEVDAI
jgi:hypothetical protein